MKLKDLYGRRERNFSEIVVETARTSSNMMAQVKSTFGKQEGKVLCLKIV